MDYHCLKVNFERQYDLVLNLHVFQFLKKLEPQILSNFNPSCILNLIRAVACLINQGIWREVYALSLKQRDKEEKYAHKREIGKEEKFEKMKKRAKTSDAMTFKKGAPTTQREQTTLPPQNRLGASSNPEHELFKEFQKFLAAQQSSVHGETVQLPTIPAQQSFPNTSRGGGNPRRGKAFPKLKLFTPKKKAKRLVLGVHNLSKKFQLNVPAAILLSKGHKFVP